MKRGNGSQVVHIHLHLNADGGEGVAAAHGEKVLSFQTGQGAGTAREMKGKSAVRRVRRTRTRGRRARHHGYVGRGREFHEYPESTRTRAMHRKEALLALHKALADGLTPGAAQRAAQARWLELTGRNVTQRQVRKWVARVKSKGGIEAAPEIAFADYKSCPHYRQRKRTK